VTERLPAAREHARRVAELVTEPDTFAAELRTGLEDLADPHYAAAHEWVAPGSTGVIGVRQPLLRPFMAAVRRALRGASPAIALYLGDRLSREPFHEARLLALVALEGSLAADPERTWQLIRRVSRGARDWVTVDTLANLVAAGILLEHYRWAELEQLVYSPTRWERRLVGSTVAQLAFRVPRGQREALRQTVGLTLIESLIGDDEPDVQKALAWALRSWRLVDAPGVEALLRREAATAVAHEDGHRAWVVRDALTGSPAPGYAAELRTALAGLRKRPGAPATSRAREVADAFAGSGMPTADELPEPPLTAAEARP
jgi:3-methyladenine DNA glycosylase AlkD